MRVRGAALYARDSESYSMQARQPMPEPIETPARSVLIANVGEAGVLDAGRRVDAGETVDLALHLVIDALSYEPYSW